MAMTERENLMKRLQVQCFAVNDINLYLDTHPDDLSAMEYYKKYRHLLEQTTRQYAESYGPIEITQVMSEDRWTWVDSPWPWEGRE